jgi:hypothetical protein
MKVLPFKCLQIFYNELMTLSVRYDNAMIFFVLSVLS